MVWQRAGLMLLLALLFLLSPVQEGRAQRSFAQTVVQKFEQLPPGVQRMHGELLRAARSGEIERLREVLQLNELMPLINGKVLHDPVKVWKARSKDHSGRELLAVLTELLELPPYKKPTKNGILYIWPYFAGVPLDQLNPREIVRLYRLAPASKVAKMLGKRRYSHAVLTMGADGTWHSFEDHVR
ncbi:MAG: hypothetical protein L3J67_04950 [Hyphomicrobiaceae bacterium]|nr:hypothetical protein [Hyphomicrobiaceae bacterium]